MLFLEEKGPSFRLMMATCCLIAGELLGFSLRRFSSAWIEIACLLGGMLIAAYGWHVRHLWIMTLMVLGMVLALRTDAGLRRQLDENAGLFGPRRRLTLLVEGPVTCRERPRKKDWVAVFPSHAGLVELSVNMPVAGIERAPLEGEVWEVDGWISRMEDQKNRYGGRRLWVTSAGHAHQVDGARMKGARACWNSLREKMSRRVGVGLEWKDELAGLNRAILLGRRSDLPRERRQMFVDAGTIHVFAISGLHVMVVAWMLNACLRKLDVSSCGRGLVCIPLVWAYVLLTGGRPSAVRAALMSTFWLIAPVLGRRPDSLAAWSATALLVYAHSPERLYDLGCVLSFAVMLGIVFWIHWSRHFRPWFVNHVHLQKIVGSLGVSMAAWVAGVPITASAFGRITPGGLLANVVVIWCAGLMVRLGVGGLLATFLSLPLAALLNNASAMFTWMMTLVSEGVASLPFSTFVVKPWSIADCLIWYVAWLLLLSACGRILPRYEHVARRWWK